MARAGIIELTRALVREQTNERKESMCLQLREALSTNRISFSNEFFSSTGAAEAKEQLKGELREFSILVDPPKTPFGKVRSA